MTATVLHTRDLEDTPFGNLDLKVVLDAVLALLVTARQAKHLALAVRHLADGANNAFSFLLDLVFFLVSHLAILRLLRLLVDSCYALG